MYFNFVFMQYFDLTEIFVWLLCKFCLNQLAR